VEGVPITGYCDGQRLETHRRLELFLTVCDGVQHAHQKGIIHRDLKPSNILVAEEDGEPRIKIIDFGVAKALDQRLTEASVFTELGQLIGTPEDMSPEQTLLTDRDIDTRTDVYSLGVLLYELLAGVLPFASSDLRQSDLDELRRKIREDEPLPPSSRISRLGDTSIEVSRRRRTDPASLGQAVRGELDWITMKALEKEPDRRYGSPAELAADILRHLRNEPLVAGPPGAAYRARKFVARHKLGVAATALIAVAVLGGLAIATTGLVRALRAEAQASDAAQQARDEARAAEEAVEYLVDLFRVSDYRESPRGELTARDILDAGADRIENEFAERPVVRARLLHAMGGAYVGVADMDKATGLLEEALSLRRELFGEDHPDTLATKHELGFLYWAKGPVEKSEPLLADVVEARTRSLGEDHPDTLHASVDLSGTYLRLGRLEDAERLLRRVLGIRSRTLGEDHPETLNSMSDLAEIARLRSQFEEAEPLYRRAIEGLLRTLGPEHIDTSSAQLGLAITYRELGRLDEAGELFEVTLDHFRRFQGERHKAVYKTALNLGELRRLQGRYAEAEELVRPTLEAWRRDLRPDHPDTLRAVYYLGLIYKDQGRFADAEPLLREAVEGRRRALGKDHPSTLRSIRSLVELYESAGTPEKAPPA
jgi:non-specific serine/threonine protein kinase/serine/threonine-protein kinase